MDNDAYAALVRRVERLESLHGPTPPGRYIPLFCMGLGLLGLGLHFKGLGLPNHAYQPALAMVLLTFAYHRRWLILPSLPSTSSRFALATLNFLNLTMLMKVVIGSGRTMPFSWAKFPTLVKATGGKWFDSMPSWEIVWQPTAVAGWEIDLTMVQTLLVLMTATGMALRFGLVASLSAILLGFCSIPAFASFNWSWAMPAILVTSVAFCLQTPRPALQESSGKWAPQALEPSAQ